MELDYIAIDLETTGLDAKRDKIIEVGAIRVQEGMETARYHSLINPHRKLESRVQELTGIRDEMVEAAPDIGDIIAGIVDFCEGLPLLGHHVIFDYGFLKRAAVNHGIAFEKSGIDTLKLCRRLMPEGESKSLAAACAFFKIERKGAHRALEDAEDAHRLYQALMRRFLDRKEIFAAEPMIYKVKKEQPASKKQKEDLRYLLKYHKIDVPVEIDYLSRNEASRLKDQIISQYGRF
ncbi:MAG: 3'-5' exonuclease [Lachnospiraceae bacterium]|nr:3'-5' exonuclease [Lachnospiraceae bacterium]